MATSPSLLLKQFEDYLDKAAGLSESDHQPALRSLPPSFRVGVVGGGITGLYSTLLLQEHFPGVKVKIFEAGNDVGGYICTYKFCEEPHQYFDGGAMRLPCTDSYKPFFNLIDHLNKEVPAHPIKLTEYRYKHMEGNRVFVNNMRQADGRIMSAEYAVKHYKELEFPEEAVDDGEANALLAKAMRVIAEAFEENFEEAMEKYGKMSSYEYFHRELGWSFEKINFIETICAQSNFFYHDIFGLFSHGLVFDSQSTLWKCIEGGFARLPQMCAEAVRNKGGAVLLNAKVKSISQSDENVKIGYSQQESKDLMFKEFDAVIMAIACPYIRLIPDRPYFGAGLEQALRSFPNSLASKFGIRFHSRFWERSDLSLPPSLGGQTVTDLPIRWVIYPSCGIGDNGKGTLLIYNWDGDSTQWQLMSKEEKLEMALSNLQVLYPEVNIADEYAGGEPGGEHYLNEAIEVDWDIFPILNGGQLLNYYPDLVRPQGSIYFAGAHLGSAYGWALSGLESARRAVRQLARKYGIEDISYIQ